MATSTQDRTYDLVDESKHPVSPVAGPYGHPFHPMLVTVPIGAWVCSLVFDIATKVKDGGDQGLAHGSYWLIGIGVLGAITAALFGMMDLTRLRRGTEALRMALLHMTLNLAVVTMFVVNFAWRQDSQADDAVVPTGPLVLSLVALTILSASGWIGGMLSYKYGVRVAHEDDQAKAFQA